ncbi:MAG: phosphohistidine phosphatase SixA, partial [Gammaproteobacteria bacterium]|nr:phosphohistidine phosphatase SixA [Gammaproteobacteria bacterium]
PLTEKGKSDVIKIGSFLKNCNTKIERILHSGKLRARQTAESIAEMIKTDAQLESSGIINPDDDPRAFAWQDDSWDRDMLVVGHLPFLNKLVSHLLIDNVDKTLITFRPGSVICLNCDDNKIWSVEWMIKPDLLIN